jgi:hypothetical protein
LRLDSLREKRGAVMADPHTEAHDPQPDGSVIFEHEHDRDGGRPTH